MRRTEKTSMRKLTAAALAGATVAAGALIAGEAAAQYYYPAPPAYYDRYDPYYRTAPAYPAPRYYDDRRSGSSLLGAVIGSVLGLNYDQSFYSRVPVDRYGPDPNGMIGPDGRRIKCKLRRSYDRYYGGTTIRRECWSR
jgi:hypothetical protein